MRKLQLLPVLWLLAATPALALSDHGYLSPSAPSVLELLSPPPGQNSPEQRRDHETVLALQNARSDAEAKRAQEDAEISVFRFAGVLGPDFNAMKVPGVAAFLTKASRETGGVNNVVKDCWERPRPFVANRDIHPAGMMAESVANRPGTVNGAPHGANSPCRPAEPTPAFSYSYPSGHSTFATTTAILLAEMVPERRAALYARGWDYGRNRAVAGVHYPSDIEAGRIEATLLIGFMMENPEFRADLAAAKQELRQVLGLP